MYHWDWGVVVDNRWMFAWGLLRTVELVVITMATSLVLGLILAVARMSTNRALSRTAYWYIEFFRGTPLLLQLYIIYQSGPFTSFLAGYIGLTLNLSAFLAEVYRSGLSSVSRRQWEAGQALGLTHRKTLMRIVIPQAVLRVIPPLGTYWVSLFRDSALVAFIGVAEVMHAAQKISVDTCRPFEAFTALAILYMAITYPQARLVGWLHEKLRVEE